MLSLNYATALLFFAAALVAGTLLGWVLFQLRTGTRFVPRERHSEQLTALRQRYRRRLRAVRDVMLRHRATEDDLRRRLQTELARGVAEAKLLDEATAEAGDLRLRIAGLSRTLAEQDEALCGLRRQEHSLRSELHAALKGLSAFESERAVLRIERDELVARTQRLQALPAAATESADGPAPELATESADRPAGGSLRAELADRDARIHELECALRESDARATSLEQDLHRWKYRIAPLALHLQQKRERAAAGIHLPPVPPPQHDRAGDDLRQIRGIGRGLEKKLRAAGITRFAQIAQMSPAELANLAVRVGVAATRPLRDRWAEQAREQEERSPLAGAG